MTGQKIVLSTAYEEEFDARDPEVIKEFLNNNIDETIGAMNTIVEDDRAVIDEGSYCWTDIELKQGKIIAHYSFSWSSYYGCDDFNKEDEVYGHIEIEYSANEGAVLLPVFQVWEKPSTFEEF